MKFYSRESLTEYHRGRAWVLFVFYAGLIIYLSHQPGNPNVVPPFPNFDKFEHFTAYFVFATLLQRALLYSNVRKGMILIAFVGAVLFGVSDEFHQSFIPHREADVLDLLADAVGASFGILIFQAMLSPRLRDPIFPGAITEPEDETSSEA